MTELLILPSLILAALLWHSYRRLDAERAAHNATQERWLAVFTKREETFSQERASLLNRIQAPEIEVAKIFDVEEPSSLEWDNDEQFNKYRDELDGVNGRS